MSRIYYLAVWLLGAVVIALWMLVAARFDAQRAHVEADNARIAKAAQRACGPEAAWRWIDSKTVQCLMHNSKKSQQVAFK